MGRSGRQFWGVDFRADARRALRQIDELRLRGPEAAQAAVAPLGKTFAEVLLRIHPRDTNRSIRGWMMAARDAGIHSGPIPAITESGWWHAWETRLEKNVARMESSVGWWVAITRRYERHQKTHYKGYKDALRTLDLWNARLRHARRMLREFRADKSRSPVLIFRRVNQGNRSRQSTIRVIAGRTFGGTGRRRTIAGRTFIEMRNLEPHALIVNKRRGKPVDTALIAVRGFGVRRASNRYVAKLEEGTDLKRTG